MILPFERLRAILERLCASFPSLSRVNVYANGGSINAKTDAELSALKDLKLNTLYMGLESGDEELLRAVCKSDTAEEMVSAGIRAEAAGLKMSVMILLGIGGKNGSDKHAVKTAEALNKMQPRLLSALRFINVPRNAYAAGLSAADRIRGCLRTAQDHKSFGAGTRRFLERTTAQTQCRWRGVSRAAKKLCCKRWIKCWRQTRWTKKALAPCHSGFESYSER